MAQELITTKRIFDKYWMGFHSKQMWSMTSSSIIISTLTTNAGSGTTTHIIMTTTHSPLRFISVIMTWIEEIWGAQTKWKKKEHWFNYVLLIMLDDCMIIWCNVKVYNCSVMKSFLLFFLWVVGAILSIHWLSKHGRHGRLWWEWYCGLHWRWW